MGIIEKIKDIELEMSRTQKNKATEFHLGCLKAKLAKLKAQLISGSKSGGVQKGEGFDVTRTGHARVGLIGFPSVGKSTLLNLTTKTVSAVAAYHFTTLTCIPGIIELHDSRIQLLDLPGIVEGAASNKGRGRQVIAVARGCDMILMMLEADKNDKQRDTLLHEIEQMGIRVNTKPPDVTITRKGTGGLRLTATVPLTKLDDKMIQAVLLEYRVHSADIVIREDVDVDQLIDVLAGNRKYMPCLFVHNKIDTTTMEEIDRLAHLPNSVVISAKEQLGLNVMLEKIWDTLHLIRVYTKPKGKAPQFTEPVIIRRGPTVEEVCERIHNELAKSFKYAMVWGTSVKHCPQRVGRTHILDDEDVIQIMSSAQPEKKASDKKAGEGKKAKGEKKKAK